MKKTLVSALTTALVVGAASTTFAAANPFSDVPADHWAYDAVTQLAADGVINGYGDGTYRGDRNITRYEMAQMIAKAMAKTDVSAKNKALIDKLAAEFRDELNNLGVRVANLEKHADMVKWNGKLEYTYEKRIFQHEYDNNQTDNTLKFRLDPQAEVNDHWTVNARLDADLEMSKDSTDSVTLKRAWAQADYNNFQAKLGKMELYTNEQGLIWDSEYSGVQVSFGDKFKATLMAGRTAGAEEASKQRYALLPALQEFAEDPASNFLGLNLQYDAGKGFYGGAGYYHLSNEAFRAMNTKSSDLLAGNVKNDDKASIWSLNAGYRFNDKAALWASYAKNSKAAFENNAWQAEFDYGTYEDAKEKGSWGAYIAYRKLGAGVSLAGTYDGVMQGTKGVELGAQYAPFKNIGVLAKYFKGKTISGDQDVSKLFGRVEFFF